MKKKVIIAVIVIVAILAVGGGILGLGVLSPKQPQLSAPTGLQVIELADGTKKIYVDRHSDAGGYLFSVQKAGESESYDTQSPANEFNANTILADATTYNIVCQYVGANANYKSPKATITYKSTIKLNAPELAFGVGQNADKLLVNTFDHYQDTLNLEYKLYYTLGNEIKTSTNFTLVHNNNHGLASLWIDLSSIITQKGVYSLCVQITELDNEYYLPVLSQQVIYVVE